MGLRLAVGGGRKEVVQPEIVASLQLAAPPLPALGEAVVVDSEQSPQVGPSSPGTLPSQALLGGLRSLLAG